MEKERRCVCAIVELAVGGAILVLIQQYQLFDDVHTLGHTVSLIGACLMMLTGFGDMVLLSIHENVEWHRHRKYKDK